MKNIRFEPKELQVVGEMPSFMPEMPGTPLYDFPVTRRQNYIATMKKEPIWQVTNIEAGLFTPQVYPDNVARGFVFEANMLAPELFGGKDMFGIEWVYVPVAGGSMVKPGSPLLNDANEWYSKVVWPDIDSWDWEGSAKSNEEYLKNNDMFMLHWIMNGYFERLISFMDFEGAAVAMIDEDQKEAVKELFEKLTDLYIKIIDKFIKYYHAEGFTVHDDWGSQKDPFFSPATCKEMLVAPMRRLTDYIHSRGCIADFHCCGHVERQVPNMVDAGWDSWSGMLMNDTKEVYEKYGDKIIIGVNPDPFGPDASEEEQRAAAKDYVGKYCQPGKPSIFNLYSADMLTPAFREELYKLSRIKFQELAEASSVGTV